MQYLKLLILTFVVFITGLISYLYFVPIPRQSDYFSINLSEQQVRGINDTERFNIQVNWNKKLRSGEPGYLELVICRDKSSQSTLNQSKKPSVTLLKDVFYDNLIIETKLEMPGLKINPGENYVESYSDSCNKVQWQIVAQEEGTYEGKVWLYFVIPQKGEKEFEKIPVLARDLEINNTLPLGFSRIVALVICGTGILLIIILSKNYIYQMINKFINAIGK